MVPSLMWGKIDAGKGKSTGLKTRHYNGCLPREMSVWHLVGGDGASYVHGWVSLRLLLACVRFLKCAKFAQKSRL